MTTPPILPVTALPHEVLRSVLAALDRGERVVLASVVQRRGSTPSTPGQKLALFEDKRALGTVGGGAVERAVLGEMEAMMADSSRPPKVESFRLGPSLGMCCGGSVDILVEPIVPEVSALIIGAGHVGTILAPMLSAAGFRVTLCDSREKAADASRLGSLLAPEEAPPIQVICAEYDDPEVSEALGQELGRAAALVMTHDHQLDQAAIEWALGKGFGFVGGVGSRAKAQRTRARLEAKGFAEDEIARVRMPLGLDIGARSPAEIAIAISAELVAWHKGSTRARWTSVATPEGQAEEHS